jgi:hypothetical protein
MSSRVRRAARRIMVTDGHEAQAMAELRRRRHSRVGRFFLELVGWPVAPSQEQVGHAGPSHQHPVRHGDSEHFLDPVCGTCGARHRTEHPPR